MNSPCQWQCKCIKKSMENIDTNQCKGINPLTPMSDQDTISLYNINTISSRQVMRIKKNRN